MCIIWRVLHRIANKQQFIFNDYHQNLCGLHHQVQLHIINVNSYIYQKIILCYAKSWVYLCLTCELTVPTTNITGSKTQ